MSFFRTLLKNIPSLLLAFVLSVAVWISAVTQTDPTVEQRYPTAIPIEIVGQNPRLILTNELPTEVLLTLRAPQSIWDKMARDHIDIHAVADFSGLERGDYQVPVRIQINLHPIEVVSYTPSTLHVSLENLANRTFPIQLITRGEPAIGFEAMTPEINPGEVNVNGPESLVNQVKEVRASFDYNNAKESVKRSLVLQAVNEKNEIINGVTITPEKTDFQVTINQRGGYRIVVVKVIISGTVASGYRVTNISVTPPTLTVYSADPRLVDSLPGYIETSALNISGAKEEIKTKLSLLLAQGISIVGDQQVDVAVGISAIEGSLTFENMPLTILGLEKGLQAFTSPDLVDVIVSGPSPALETLRRNEVKLMLDLTGMKEGTFTMTPRIEFPSSDFKMETLLPSTIEVTIVKSGSRPPKPIQTPAP